MKTPLLFSFFNFLSISKIIPFRIKLYNISYKKCIFFLASLSIFIMIGLPSQSQSKDNQNEIKHIFMSSLKRTIDSLTKYRDSKFSYFSANRIPGLFIVYIENFTNDAFSFSSSLFSDIHEINFGVNPKYKYSYNNELILIRFNNSIRQSLRDSLFFRIKSEDKDIINSRIDLYDKIHQTNFPAYICVFKDGNISFKYYKFRDNLPLQFTPFDDTFILHINDSLYAVEEYRFESFFKNMILPLQYGPIYDKLENTFNKLLKEMRHIRDSTQNSWIIKDDLQKK